MELKWSSMETYRNWRWSHLKQHAVSGLLLSGGRGGKRPHKQALWWGRESPLNHCSPHTHTHGPLANKTHTHTHTHTHLGDDLDPPHWGSSDQMPQVHPSRLKVKNDVWKCMIMLPGFYASINAHAHIRPHIKHRQDAQLEKWTPVN